MTDTKGPIGTDAAEDPRSDLQQAVEARADASKNASNRSPLEPSGVKDGVGGTAGEVKNQDQSAQ